MRILWLLHRFRNQIEEELRAGFGDIIWASAKLEGTMLIIDVQENLATNQQANNPKDIGVRNAVLVGCNFFTVVVHRVLAFYQQIPGLDLAPWHVAVCVEN